MNKLKLEFFVGLFVLSGVVAISYMAIRMGDIGLFEQQGYYELVGRFDSVSGLKEGAAVEMSGVKVGRVKRIEFDRERFQAVVTMEVPDGIELSTDSVASIRTSGIIGDKYIKVSIGGEEEILQPGDQFEQTESSLDIEELISRFVFSSDDQ
ncbi:outer membrane lipid asymmetry maintenance protein MlaD [Pleionea litopenaei]|uniref:Outer membrane lipid asymmetry maintenance protein MlaD n=1 Tax=Pleionea litopenaei TaxID=3070815 RepID=A0AA51RSB3_9GAMM|nr:outer membrane lipid asymmetry maintenance protein MlaD [Pleionea sp. HL-JVS1]WMS86685.1 outer membrane lipid asymmetry maintenance protein MlaD [Pleionea sp. HL-JVS1]